MPLLGCYLAAVRAVLRQEHRKVDEAIESPTILHVSKQIKQQLEEELSDGELQAAVESSGYPCEVELFNQFVSAGAQATLEHLLPLGVDGRMKEIDLTA